MNNVVVYVAVVVLFVEMVTPVATTIPYAFTNVLESWPDAQVSAFAVIAAFVIVVTVWSILISIISTHEYTDWNKYIVVHFTSLIVAVCAIGITNTTLSKTQLSEQALQRIAIWLQITVNGMTTMCAFPAMRWTGRYLLVHKTIDSMAKFAHNSLSFMIMMAIVTILQIFPTNVTPAVSNISIVLFVKMGVCFAAYTVLGYTMQKNNLRFNDTYNEMDTSDDEEVNSGDDQSHDIDEPTTTDTDDSLSNNDEITNSV